MRLGRIVLVLFHYFIISLFIIIQRISKKFHTKDQLISKGRFGFFNSPKKRTKNFSPSRLGQKFEFSSSFFGRIGDTKKTFRN